MQTLVKLIIGAALASALAMPVAAQQMEPLDPPASTSTHPGTTLNPDTGG